MDKKEYIRLCNEVELITNLEQASEHKNCRSQIAHKVLTSTGKKLRDNSESPYYTKTFDQLNQTLSTL